MLAERVPVLTYGANRNPGTLLLKLSHYGYRSPGVGVALPVLRARIGGAEAVASGFSGQGYFYADLLVGDPSWTADELEVWVNLVDRDALRVLHESEGVGVEGGYVVVGLSDVDVTSLGRTARVLGYMIDGPTLQVGAFGGPVAFSSIGAVGRRVQTS